MKRSILLAVLFLCGSKACADVLTVGPGGYATIQAAINDANNGDTVLVTPGTYQENISFLGKAIAVRSADPNNANVVADTIIDGSNPPDANYGSVVTFNSGEDNNSVLAGFTITGGTGSWLLVSWEYKGLRWNRCGGGVICYDMSAPTISSNLFVDNFAGEGGAVYVYGDPVDGNDPSDPPEHVSPVITDNVFIDNSAVVEHGFAPPNADYPENNHGDGGAIVAFQGCDPVIVGNLIQDNEADAYGGGLHLRQWSHGLMEDNHIISNDSLLGAGVHITYASSPTIRRNLIERNAAGSLGGGGIYVYYLSEPVIELNTITQNESTNGAGIAVLYSSNPTIRNNLIVNNFYGAGVRIKGHSAPVIANNTIVANTATPPFAGGVDCLGDSVVVIENNVIASNGDSYGIYASSTLPIMRHNNVWGNGAGNYSAVIGDQTGISGNMSTDPRFVDVNDYHLSLSSPCINAGDPNFVAGGLTDFDGQPRVMGQFLDIGADEAKPVWNTVSARQYETIQEAVDDANNGDVIVLATVTHTGPGNRDVDFDGKAVTVQSTDPNDPDVVAATVIDCQGSVQEPHRAFRFGSGEDANSIVSGLTITGGHSLYGAVYCHGASPTIEKCIVRDNFMNDHGGGFYCGNNSNPAIRNCIITSNSFAPYGYGGAIYCSQSSPTVTNCIITNNSAAGPGRHGGGICCWGDQNASSNPIVANCIVVGNSAGRRGGGLYAYWSSPTFVNCTVIGNKSLEGGGIGCFRQSNPAVINCIVRDNRAPDGNELALVARPVSIPTEMTVSYSNIKGGQEQVCVDDGMILHWGEGNIDVDPNFLAAGHWDDANTPGDPNDDFFVAGNYHLRLGSPCVNSGDNNSVPVSSEEDIDGEQRIFEGRVDIGADEAFKNPMDLNTDGIIDYLELAAVTDEWLDSGSQMPGDFYPDDFIDFADLSVLGAEWLWKAGWYEQ
jgi:parallel beta-helix repeat protein